MLFSRLFPCLRAEGTAHRGYQYNRFVGQPWGVVALDGVVRW